MSKTRITYRRRKPALSRSFGPLDYLKWSGRKPVPVVPQARRRPKGGDA